MNAEPLVRVVRGEPAADEIAALVTVLATRSKGTDSGAARPSIPAWVVGARPAAPARSWRESGLPR
jgi:hypothetical protein